jgi:Uma2 family endonuclease
MIYLEVIMELQPDTPPPSITAEELFWLAPEGPCELRRGEVIHLSPTGFEHGRLMTQLARLLGNFVAERALGEVLTGDAGFILSRSPDTVRAPDVAFVQKARLPGAGLQQFFPGPPDLAVEVVSPSDRWVDVEEKIQEYLLAGTREVWVVSPRDRSIRLWAGPAPGAPRLFTREQTLTSDLLAGFSLPLSSLFP